MYAALMWQLLNLLGVCAANCGLLDGSAADVQITVGVTAKTVVWAYQACHLTVAKDHVALIANSCNWQRYFAAMECIMEVIVGIVVCHGPMCD